MTSTSVEKQTWKIGISDKNELFHLTKRLSPQFGQLICETVKCDAMARGFKKQPIAIIGSVGADDEKLREQIGVALTLIIIIND